MEFQTDAIALSTGYTFVRILATVLNDGELPALLEDGKVTIPSWKIWTAFGAAFGFIFLSYAFYYATKKRSGTAIQTIAAFPQMCIAWSFLLCGRWNVQGDNDIADEFKRLTMTWCFSFYGFIQVIVSGKLYEHKVMG